MNKFFTFFLILLFAACSAPQKATENIETEKPKKYIPQYAKDFAKEMKQKYPERYVGLKFFYDEEENGIAEVLIEGEEKIYFNGRKRTTVITDDWTPRRTMKKIKSYIGNDEIEYSLTAKKADEAEQRIEQRRKDPAFTEIEKVIFQIATEYKYDYEKAYGKEVKYRNPNTKKAVCDGYTNAVIEAFKNNPLVERVEKWTSAIGKHAWNVIILKDGRKIYCDATWYQRQGIDSEDYVKETISKTPVNLTFDIEEFNTLGGAINESTGEIMKVHFAWEDAKLSK